MQLYDIRNKDDIYYNSALNRDGFVIGQYIIDKDNFSFSEFEETLQARIDTCWLSEFNRQNDESEFLLIDQG